MFQRGNAVCHAPASRDAGASSHEFPQSPWELERKLIPSNFSLFTEIISINNSKAALKKWDRFKVAVIVLKCTRELFFTSNNHAQQRDQCFFLRFGLICGQSPGKSSDKVALVMSHRTFEKAKLVRPFTR
jgi:hypothetical protein